MGKRRQVERQRSATREVTVHLDGYPAYTRHLSGHHPGHWEVKLKFACPGIVRTVTVFASADYEEAFKKYEVYLPIVYLPSKKEPGP